MAPNFALFCQMTEQKPADKTYHNILNLVWEFLTVKEAKINFENQLEKLEEIIPDVNDYDFFGVVPALDACEALGELLSLIHISLQIFLRIHARHFHQIILV